MVLGEGMVVGQVRSARSNRVWIVEGS